MLAARKFYYFSFELAMRARYRLFNGRCVPGAVCSAGDEWRQIVHFEMSGGNSRETGSHFFLGDLKTASRWKMLEKPPLIVGREATRETNCSRDQLICSRNEGAAHMGIDVDCERCNPKHGRVEGDPSTQLLSIFYDGTSARSHPRWGFLCRSEWRAIARQTLRKRRQRVRPRWVWG